jgi:hypothetical protein
MTQQVLNEAKKPEWWIKIVEGKIQERSKRNLPVAYKSL